MCPHASMQTTVWRVGVNSRVADVGMSATQMLGPSNRSKTLKFARELLVEAWFLLARQDVFVSLLKARV